MASWLIPSIIACLLTTGILLLVYGFLYWRYPGKSLLLWSMGWLFYFFRFAFMLAYVGLEQSPHLLIANQQATLVSGLFLLAGTYSFVRRKLPYGWLVCGVLMGGWIAGAILLRLGFMAVTLPSFLFIGCAQIWTGITLVRTKGISPFARLLPGITFVVWGLHKLDYPFLRSLEWFAPWGYLIGAALALLLAVSLLLGFFEQFKNEVSRKDRLFRNTFDHAAIGLAHVSMDGTWLRLNSTFCDILGRSEAVLLDARVWLYVHPDEVTPTRELFERAECSSVGRETRLIRSDGSVVWVYMTMSCVPEGREQDAYVVLAAEDISGRKKMERRLRESERKYRLLVDHVSVGVGVAQEGRLVFTNPHLEELAGRPGADLLNRSFMDFIHPEDQRLVHENHLRRLSGEDVSDTYSFRIVDERKRSRVVEMTSLLYEWNGEPATLNFLVDITDTLARQRQVESLARFPRENPNPVLRLNSHGRPVYYNPAAERVFGWEGADSEVPETLMKEASLALSSGAMRQVDLTVGQRTYLFGLSPLMELGEVNLYGMDITERASLEKELKAAHEKCTGVSEAKSEFLADICNELRIPLQAMTGLMRPRLQTGQPGGDDDRVRLALECGESLTLVLDDLLRGGGASSELPCLENRPFHLVDAVELLQEFFADTLRAENNRLEVHLDEPHTPLVGDRGCLRQVVFHLVANALAASRKAVVRVHLGVLPCARREHRTLLLTVGDQGAGIPDGLVEHAFDPIARVWGRPPNGLRGAGLALGIVHRLVKTMDGTICVDTEPGRGCDIHVTVPLPVSPGDRGGDAD